MKRTKQPNALEHAWAQWGMGPGLWEGRYACVLCRRLRLSRNVQFHPKTLNAYCLDQDECSDAQEERWERLDRERAASEPE